MKRITFTIARAADQGKSIFQTYFTEADVQSYIDQFRAGRKAAAKAQGMAVDAEGVPVGKALDGLRAANVMDLVRHYDEACDHKSDIEERMTYAAALAHLCATEVKVDWRQCDTISAIIYEDRLEIRPRVKSRPPFRDSEIFVGYDGQHRMTAVQRVKPTRH
jgi:hypothetical protein